MPFDYEEFNPGSLRTYPLASRENKARHEDFARRGIPRPAWRAGSSRCRTCSARPTSVLSSPQCSRRAAEVRHHLGTRRARHQDRPRACADRFDGARLRVRHRDERGGSDSRLRSRAERLDLRGRGRQPGSGAVRHGRGDRPRAECRHRRRRHPGPRTGQAVAEHLASRHPPFGA